MTLIDLFTDTRNMASEFDQINEILKELGVQKENIRKLYIENKDMWTFLKEGDENSPHINHS